MSEGRMTVAEVGRQIMQLRDEISKFFDDHETRLRRVERFMWAAAALGASGGLPQLAHILASLGGG